MGRKSVSLFVQAQSVTCFIVCEVNQYMVKMIYQFIPYDLGIIKGSVQWNNDFSSNRSLNIVKKDGILNFIVVCFI